MLFDVFLLLLVISHFLLSNFVCKVRVFFSDYWRKRGVTFGGSVDFMVMVILSALVERFNVSCMQDFSIQIPQNVVNYGKTKYELDQETWLVPDPIG